MNATVTKRLDPIYDEPPTGLSISFSPLIAIVSVLGVLAGLLIMAYVLVTELRSSAVIDLNMGFIGVGGALLAIAGTFHAVGRFQMARFAMFAKSSDQSLARWKFDYPWNPAGVFAREKLYQNVGYLFILIALAIVLVPISIKIFTLKPRQLPYSMGYGLMILACGMALAFTVMQVLNLFQKGPVSVGFNKFPYFFGDKMQLAVKLPEALDAYDSMEVILRCIKITKSPGERSYEERLNTNSTGIEGDTADLILSTGGLKEERDRGSGGPSYNGEQQYAETQVFNQEELSRLKQLHLTFDIPDDALETDLSADPPVYWELVVRSKSPDVGFDTSFLLPVYDKFRAQELSQA